MLSYHFSLTPEQCCQLFWVPNRGASAAQTAAHGPKVAQFFTAPSCPQNHPILVNVAQFIIITLKTPNWATFFVLIVFYVCTNMTVTIKNLRKKWLIIGLFLINRIWIGLKLIFKKGYVYFFNLSKVLFIWKVFVILELCWNLGQWLFAFIFSFVIWLQETHITIILSYQQRVIMFDCWTGPYSYMDIYF